MSNAKIKEEWYTKDHTWGGATPNHTYHLESPDEKDFALCRPRTLVLDPGSCAINDPPQVLKCKKCLAKLWKQQDEDTRTAGG